MPNMTTSVHRLAAVLALLVTGIPAPSQAVPVDQIPMYGNMDRSSVPGLREADERLIADTSKHYGSRETASGAFADQGFRFYYAGDLENAMRRFNQRGF